MSFLNYLKEWFFSTKPVLVPVMIGRNETCHCGSGIKYKRCCMEADNKIISKQNACACNTSTSFLWELQARTISCADAAKRVLPTYFLPTYILCLLLSSLGSVYHMIYPFQTIVPNTISDSTTIAHQITLACCASSSRIRLWFSIIVYSFTYLIISPFDL